MSALPKNAAAKRDSVTDRLGLNSVVQDTEAPPTEACAVYWFAAMEACEVRYAILRGADEASAKRPGADVDLIVHPDDLKSLEECLEVACEHSGATIVQSHKTPHARQYMLHGRTDAGVHSLLCLDVHTAEACFGAVYLDSEALLQKTKVLPATRFRWENTGDPAQVPMVHPAWAGFVRFQNGFLSGAEVLPEHVGFLKEAQPADAEAISRQICRLYGARMGEDIVLALREGDPERLRNQARAARRRLLWRRLRYAPLRTLSETIQTASALRVRPYLKPRGLCVAFLGTDGTGKSTLIDAMQEVLQPHFRDGKSGVRKLRPGLLPQINRLIHWRKASYSLEDCMDPHRAKPSGSIGSALRCSWYAIDCILGWPLRILPLRRRNALLVFDRYFLDFLVDPRRARIHPASVFPKLWSRFIPQPDAMLVCVADPESIYKRKQELEPKEISRQVSAYTNLASQFERMHLIRTDGSVEDSLDQVLSAIFVPHKK